MIKQKHLIYCIDLEYIDVLMHIIGFYWNIFVYF